jgi:hypothetical protein
MTAAADEVRYLILADKGAPYLLARVRWPDVAQAITARCPDWLDDIGLLDLPYDPNVVAVSFTQAASVAAAWGTQLRAEPVASAPSFIRRMPANWSDLSLGERHAFGLDSGLRRRISERRLRRVQAQEVKTTAPVPAAVSGTGYGPGITPVEGREHVRVRVNGRVHIQSGEATISAVLVDLSEGGMRCVLPDAPLVLAAGDALSGPFLLEGEAKSRVCLAVPGRVSWVLDTSSGMHFGVTLGDPDGAEIDGVRRFLVTAGNRRG